MLYVCIALQDDTHEHSFLLPASFISCLLLTLGNSQHE